MNGITTSTRETNAPKQKDNQMTNNTINTATTAVQKAEENLTQARTDLAEIKATIVELDRAYDSDEELPKGHQSKVDTAQGRLIQLDRAVSRREASLSEARAILAQAEIEDTEANLVNLAETVQNFDRDAWVEKVRTLLQPVIDEHLTELHRLEQTHTELDAAIRADGRHEFPRNQHAGRVGKTNGFYKDATLDGASILRPNPASILDDLKAALVDTVREDTARQARAELAAEAQAESAERNAQAAEFRRQHEAARGPAPTGATVSRDRDGKEVWVRPATSHKAGHGNR